MGRILGIDYGSARIGLALSDPTHLIASPLETITFSSEKDLIAQLREKIDAQEVEEVVVGMPFRMKGGDSRQTESVRKFVTALKKAGISAKEEDERLSSVSAKRALIEQELKMEKDKGLVDQTAAAIMLQQYLDKKRSG
ncbi:MAG: Holliday junction resolvase RuvX [Candidatus Marinimicrobia bacterium]|jgi:putative Holliday junction resolvase|nr:Holliday junction resolvase RuvX [Candidatus Neomarinimicrobiota bacterium]MDP6789577.1 Holliday junction resolvase RuvX [Candidatus Neomarinimicrobiota bacterium]MDP7071843.1 Holliday junction resolvase RuvX [Candidatus Neomarinimicrobiota bacterium]